jgi:hypothetical protein
MTTFVKIEEQPNKRPKVLTIDGDDKMTEVYYNASLLKALAKVDTTDPCYDAEKYLKKKDISSIENIISKGKFNFAEDTITLSQDYKVKKYDRIAIGRMYIKNPTGFQNINKKLRRLAMNNNYVSIDIANCQPRLLHDLCTLHDGQNYDSKVLTEYINEREKVRTELCDYYDTNKQTVKKLILRMMYGGKPETWMREEAIQEKPHHPTVLKLHRELVYIKTEHAKEFPDFNDAVKLYAIAEKKHLEDSSKKLDSAMAVYLQDEERKILGIIKKTLKQKYGIIGSAQIHDALLIHKSTKYKLTEELLEELQNEIRDTLGYNTQLEYEDVAYTTEDKEYIEEHLQFSFHGHKLRSDQVHAANWLEIFKEKIYNTDAGLHIYDKARGMWTKKDSDMLLVVGRRAPEIFVDVVDVDKNKTALSMYNSALRWVTAMAPKKPFLDIKKNRGYFLFQNGVLDCSTMAMKEFSPDYFLPDELTGTLTRSW